MRDDQMIRNSTECEERKESAGYAVGSCVSYRAEGICDIQDIRKETFGAIGEGTDYYILSPRNDPNSLVYVPVNNEQLTALMRPLLGMEEIRALAASLREERMEWIPDSRGRNTRFREILSLGDRRELIVLIHTVREHIDAGLAVGKKPGSTDTGALRRASKLLRDEFAAAVTLNSDEELFLLLDGEEPAEEA